MYALARRPLWRRLITVVASAALLVSVPIGAASAADQRVSSPGARYVALGDSYSSGEGLFDYDPATDTADNHCHRSPLAYGPLLSYAAPRYRPFAFVACSGASTADLYAPNDVNAREPRQLDALSRQTRTVTLTLGGNDAGFAETLLACIRARAASAKACSDDPRLTTAVAVRTSALAGTTTFPGITAMSKVLADIHAAAPRAAIYVGGYPELFGHHAQQYAVDPGAAGGRSCTLLATGYPPADRVLTYPDAQWIDAATRTLNGVLQASVRQARYAGVDARFVPVATAFAGHGLCDDQDPWINAVVPIPGRPYPRPESLHPNLSGSLAYAYAFYAATSGGQRLPAAVRRYAGLR